MHEKKEKGERSSFNFPWGFASIGTLLRKQGYHVHILDGQALQLEKKELAPLIEKYTPDVVGITAFSTQYNAVRHLSKYVKDRIKIPVVVGGPLPTYQASLVLKTTDVDICVIGEGEIVIFDLLDNFEDPEKVKGIAFKKRGEIFFTEPQDKLFNLDDLPVPDFELFDMQKYLHQDNAFARKKSSGKSMMIISSRGCPYSCNFCSKSSKYFRSMSPEKIYDFLYILKKEFGLEEAVFGDELFLSSKKRFGDLAPLLKSLDIQWGGQARVNLMDKEFLDMAKSTGCIGLGYGIESGSNKILKNMNKNITTQQIEFAMKYTNGIGIPVKVQLIFGYPGEDEETIQETIDLFKKVDHPGRRFNVITPIPGSRLYEDCLTQGSITDEAAYLRAIEKSFGIGKVHVNFTKWPDDEIYPRKEEAEKTMYMNYINNSTLRKAAFKAKRLRKKFFP